MHARSSSRRAALVIACLTGCLLPAGCRVTGSGKGSGVAWKTYKTEHPRPAPDASIQSGGVELRVRKVFLVEQSTVIETKGWVGRVRAEVRSPEPLLLSTLSEAFTLIGASGEVYDASVTAVGPARATWQRQEHTGQPTHLPANVPGEIEIWAHVGGESGHDELAAFTFRGQRVELPR